MATTDLRDKIREASRLMYHREEATEETMQHHNQLQSPTVAQPHPSTPPMSSSQSQRSNRQDSPYQTGLSSYLQGAYVPGSDVHGLSEANRAINATGITITGDDAYATPDSNCKDSSPSSYIRMNIGAPAYNGRSNLLATLHESVDGGISIVDRHNQPSVPVFNPVDREMPGHKHFASAPIDRGPAPPYSSFDDSAIIGTGSERPPRRQQYAASSRQFDSLRPNGVSNEQATQHGIRNATATPHAANAGRFPQYQRHFDMNTAMEYLSAGTNKVNGIDSWPLWLEDPVAQDQIVQELFDAVYSLEMAQDGPNGQGTESREYRAVAEGKISSKNVEAYCWRLFLNVRDIHVSGTCFTQEKPPTITMAVKAELSDGLGIRVDSNEDCKTNVLQRFQNIKYALKRCKIFTNDLHHEGKSKMLALAPLGMLSKKGVYRANNMQKQARLKEQRVLKKAADDAAQGIAKRGNEADGEQISDLIHINNAPRTGSKRLHEDETDDISGISNKRTRTSFDVQRTDTTQHAIHDIKHPYQTSALRQPLSNEMGSCSDPDFPSSRKIRQTLASGSSNEDRTLERAGDDSSPLANYGSRACTTASVDIEPDPDLGGPPTVQTQDDQHNRGESQSFESEEDLEEIVHYNGLGPNLLNVNSASYLILHPQPATSQHDSWHPNTSALGPLSDDVNGGNAASGYGFLETNTLKEWGFDVDDFLPQDSGNFLDDE